MPQYHGQSLGVAAHVRRGHVDDQRLVGSGQTRELGDHFARIVEQQVVEAGERVAADVSDVVGGMKQYGCEMISDPGVIPLKFRAPGGTVAELVPKGRYKQLED